MKAMFTCLFEGATSSKAELNYKIRHNVPQWEVFILYIGFIHAIPWFSQYHLSNTMACLQLTVVPFLNVGQPLTIINMHFINTLTN